MSRCEELRETKSETELSVAVADVLGKLIGGPVDDPSHRPAVACYRRQKLEGVLVQLDLLGAGAGPGRLRKSRSTLVRCRGARTVPRRGGVLGLEPDDAQPHVGPIRASSSVDGTGFPWAIPAIVAGIARIYISDLGRFSGRQL